MKQLCVFCGSSPGGRSEYLAVARSLGELLATRGIGLVYGGAGVGLMGELARTVLAAGGEVVGVIPRALADREVALNELPDLRVVGSMHERKALMAELADGFLALPGGLGTIEELLEVLTWAQLGMHQKPCGVLNICRYYDSLVGFLEHSEREGFVNPAQRALLLVEEDPAILLDRFTTYQAPNIDKAKWILSLSNS